MTTVTRAATQLSRQLARGRADVEEHDSPSADHLRRRALADRELVGDVVPGDPLEGQVARPRRRR